MKPLSQARYLQVMETIPKCLKSGLFGYSNHRDGWNDRLAHLWISGGKERYERTGNPMERPKYMAPPPLSVEERDAR